jgi:hypothetical protein
MADDNRDRFKQAGRSKTSGVIGEFFLFLKENKKYWLIPPIVALLLIGLVVMLGGTAAAPFIYSFF